MLRPVSIAGLCVVFILAGNLPASAETFVVTNTGDSGPGTLRQAIVDAHALAGADVIEFAIPGDGPHTIALTTGGLNITSDITIDGATQPGFQPGTHQIIVSGSNQFRVFDVTGTTVMNGLSITGGNSEHDNGGGIRSTGNLTLTDCTVSRNRASAGGGINQGGMMTLINSTVSRNLASFLGGGISSFGTVALTNCTLEKNYSSGPGGGIYITGSLTLTGSTVSGNAAYTSLGGGGGIFNEGSLRLVNSTVSANVAYGIFEGGGGILNLTFGTLTLINSTVNGNSTLGPFAGDGGGISNSNAARLTLTNSIVANSTTRGNPGGDCFRSGNDIVNDTGFNIIADGSCISHPTSLAGDPLLGPLADNGGITLTHALLADSPAIDAGDCSSGTITTDQRGAPRPQGQGCDIGAFEAPDGDGDGDGVLDGDDICPDSDVGETLVIDKCDTGVANEVSDEGCTRSDMVAHCGTEAPNHGQFVQCVALLANSWRRSGAISDADRGRIVRCAARADIPPSDDERTIKPIRESRRMR